MSETQFDVVVVGAGPGGYVAAIRAAQLGLNTAIVEAQHLGGICLNWGCIPTKALLAGAELATQLKHAGQFGFQVSQLEFDLQQLVKHSRQVSAQLVQGIAHLLKKNQVTVFDAKAKLIGKETLQLTDANGKQQTLTAPHIILATGAQARHLPQLPVDGKYVWSYKEALVPEQLPKRLLVVGSGAIGSEFASLYQDLGCQVTLIDIAKLTHNTVKFFNHEPVMAMLSYSNFGSDKEGSPASVHKVVDTLHNSYPEMIVDGEMQVNFALNKELRDKKFPFSKLAGKDVNTLVFPNLSSANTAYKMLLEMGLAETIGPIQMGLKKPIHILDVESSVRDIVNMTAIAVLDAMVQEQIDWNKKLQEV